MSLEDLLLGGLLGGLAVYALNRPNTKRHLEGTKAGHWMFDK